MARLQLTHLSEEEHAEAAKLLTAVQDNLKALARIPKRAPWIDEVMRAQKAVQEKLIDPLREAHDALREREQRSPERGTLYPSVYYAVGRRR